MTLGANFMTLSTKILVSIYIYIYKNYLDSGYLYYSQSTSGFFCLCAMLVSSTMQRRVYLKKKQQN